MIYLELLWTFFKIGLFTFGGGYAMIPLVESEVVSKGWLTAEEFSQILSISEATPGPIAVNMATMVGSLQAGIGGSILATLGVVLPSFIIIIIVSLILRKFIKNKYVRGFMHGVKPVIIGLIFAAGVTLLIRIVYPLYPLGGGIFTIQGLALTILLGAFYAVFKFVTKKALNPIYLIIASALMGMLIYSF